MFKKYIDYVKDNPNHYWFKRKLYGWGWTPATWQGWLTLAVFIALIFVDFHRVDRLAYSTSDTVDVFVIHVIVLTIILIAVCYWKGEKPKWTWGVPKKGESVDIDKHL